MSYILLEEKLRLKKVKLQKLDDELRITKEKFLKGMNENKSERLTNQGISENAILYITLIEAKDLKPINYNGSSNPYVVFNIDEKKQNLSYKSNTLDPTWSEDFTFPIVNRSSVLKVEVWDKHSFSGQELQGYVNIPLRDLEDQQKSDKWFNLAFGNTPNENGEIRLKLHYIYSLYKFYNDNYNKTEIQILRLQEDINELNRYFEMFKKPFGIILFGEIESIIEKRILERSEDLSAYMASNRKSVYISPRYSVFKSGMVAKVENVFRANLSKI